MTLPRAKRPHVKGAENAPNRGFWAIRDVPSVLWLVLTVAAIAAHRALPEPRWLMIHLLLLGAVTHAILVWSAYFSHALLRSRPSHRERREQSLRLALANGGACLVLVGVPASVWAVTVIGAVALIAAVAWHGASLARRMRRSLPGQFGHTVRYYIVAAALVAIGMTLGTLAAGDIGSPRLVLAHAITNLLGWIGITVAGTVVTLWPTILRTRAHAGAARSAARALPVLSGGVVVAAIGAMLASLPLVALGLAAYLVGIGFIGVPLWRATRRTPPRSFAALSVGAALCWWSAGILAALASAIALIGDALGITLWTGLVLSAIPVIVAGFAAQVLVGALSYLIPVVLGGGPGPVRAGTAAFERLGGLRIAVANASLLVYALPVAGIPAVVASGLYVIAIGSFLPVMFAAMRAQGRAKRATAATVSPPRAARAADADRRDERSTARAGQAVAGLIVVVLAITASIAADPLSAGWTTPPVGDADAPVTTVRVEAADMRFTPNLIEVPEGNRLVIELANTDPSETHDLVLDVGVASARLAPGETERIDVGVISAAAEGWCSVVGHRQMGMTLSILVIAEASAGGADGHAVGAHDPPTTPAPGFVPFDASLPPLPPSAGVPATHQVTMTVRDTVVEVAPGVTQTLWTYNGTAPGPTLHGRVGDRFEITLVNDATMGHSIDFHAGALAPDEVMRTIPPGEQLTYSFTATRAGIWMYHCSTMPMSAHIANGMYGAVVIEPAELPAVDRSFVLVQGEYYLGDPDGGVVDTEKIEAREPDLVVFNGYANQYDHAPLEAVAGERIRVWVLDAGIERPTSFHIVGGQFDTVWSEGAYLINNEPGVGSQALALQPAQGGFVELAFPEVGNYPFVSHLMIDAEAGAHGVFAVSAATP